MKLSKCQPWPGIVALGVVSGAMFANTVGIPLPDALAQTETAEPESAVALYRHGMTLRQEGKLAAAAVALRAAVRRDPSLTEAQSALAEIYLQQGEHNLAFAAIGNAMKAETRKEKADLTPFINLLGRVDMNQVDAKQAAAESARVEAADLKAEKPPAQSPPAEKPAPAERSKVGESIEVEWKGLWYPAKILETKDGTFKIRYHGYSENWDEWVTAARIRRQSAAPGQTASTEARPAQANQTPQNNVGPRLGKYYILSYGSPYNPPINLGHFVLMPGGRYRASNTSKEEYYGEGKYSFDAKSSAVKWLSGPFKNNDWGGGFTVKREGKTHRIELARTTLGFNDLK